MINNISNLLVIVGPTAAGKTSIALHIAKVFNGELLSADSRQVYKDMNIGTGKDIPENSNFQFTEMQLGSNKIGFYEIEGVRVWGYDLAEPTEEFSVSHYVNFSKIILKDIRERGKLPILVGGTGLYIKAIVDGIETVAIPRNLELRNQIKNESAERLYEILAKADSLRAALLNTSDKRNPRRLIRSIEVANWKRNNKLLTKTNLPNETNTLFIGLTAPIEKLFNRVERNILKRVGGIEQEIQELFTKGVEWKMQSMNSLGYKEWKEYLEGNATKADVIKKWRMDEKKYVKRQLTWFKKDTRINWFDISKVNWQKDVESVVKKWYKKNS